MARTYRYKGKKLTLQQMLASPGSRSKLPDRLLPADQLARRQRNAATKSRLAGPLYTPGAPMAGKDLDKAATALTDLQVKPKIGALEREGASTEKQGTAVIDRQRSYYDTLAREAQGGLDRQKAISQMLQDRIRANGQDAQERVVTGRQLMTGTALQDAAVRGGGLQSSARAAEEIAAAGANAGARTQTAADLGALQGANWEGLGSTTKSVTQLRGGERSEQLENRMLNSLADVRSRRSEVEASRGDEYTKNLLDLRNRSFEDQVASAGILNDERELTFKASEAEATRQHQSEMQRLANSAREKLQRQRLAQGAEEKAKYNLTADEKAALEREKIAQRDKASRRSSRGKGRLGNGGAMPADVRKARTAIDSIVEEGRGGALVLPRGKDPKTGVELEAKSVTVKGLRENQVYSKLVKAGLDRMSARAASQLITRGALTAATRTALERAGMKIPKSWLGSGAAGYNARG